MPRISRSLDAGPYSMKIQAKARSTVNHNAMAYKFQEPQTQKTDAQIMKYRLLDALLLLDGDIDCGSGMRPLMMMMMRRRIIRFIIIAAAAGGVAVAVAVTAAIVAVAVAALPSSAEKSY